MFRQIIACKEYFSRDQREENANPACDEPNSANVRAWIGELVDQMLLDSLSCKDLM